MIAILLALIVTVSARWDEELEVEVVDVDEYCSKLQSVQYLQNTLDYAEISFPGNYTPGMTVTARCSDRREIVHYLKCDCAQWQLLSGADKLGCLKS